MYLKKYSVYKKSLIPIFQTVYDIFFRSVEKLGASSIKIILKVNVRLTA